MRFLSRILLFPLLALLAVSSLSACGGGEDKTTAGPGPAPRLSTAPDAAAERRVENQLFISTARPSLRILVDNDLPWQGKVANMQLEHVKDKPVAVSRDAAEAFVFLDAPAKHLKRAAVLTFVEAKSRASLPREDFAWIDAPLERNVHRAAGQEFAFASGAFEQPLEYFVANALEAKKVTWSGCHLVGVLHRQADPANSMYLFYIERVPGRCEDWRKPLDSLPAERKDLYNAFFLNMVKSLQFQP